MGIKERAPIIESIEQIRGSKVICLLTSMRVGVPSQIAQDCIRVMFDHLLKLPVRPVDKLDVFLVSNGGESTVPWRLTALFREFSKSFSVLIPYRAYSAATLLALGADEIVMHPFAEMGPIDPSVSNEFNPTANDGRTIPISVEDVSSYVEFIKTTTKIEGGGELLKALDILLQRVHPLAIGNVSRFLSQSRLIARKIMSTHKDRYSEDTMTEIIEQLATKLYFHGHPINRQEAKNDLGLKVCVDLPTELETAMWQLYLDFEEEFNSRKEFDPSADILDTLPTPPVQTRPIPPRQHMLIHAIVESRPLSSSYVAKHRFSLSFDQQGNLKLLSELRSRNWVNTPSP
jgi:Serine dehydrogenase proteinase